MPIKYQKISNEGKIEGPVFFDNGKYSTNYIDLMKELKGLGLEPCGIDDILRMRVAGLPYLLKDKKVIAKCLVAVRLSNVIQDTRYPVDRGYDPEAIGISLWNYINSDTALASSPEGYFKIIRHSEHLNRIHEIEPHFNWGWLVIDKKEYNALPWEEFSWKSVIQIRSHVEFTADEILESKIWQEVVDHDEKLLDLYASMLAYYSKNYGRGAAYSGPARIMGTKFSRQPPPKEKIYGIRPILIEGVDLDSDIKTSDFESGAGKLVGEHPASRK